MLRACIKMHPDLQSACCYFVVLREVEKNRPIMTSKCCVYASVLNFSPWKRIMPVKMCILFVRKECLSVCLSVCGLCWCWGTIRILPQGCELSLWPPLLYKGVTNKPLFLVSLAPLPIRFHSEDYRSRTFSASSVTSGVWAAELRAGAAARTLSADAHVYLLQTFFLCTAQGVISVPVRGDTSRLYCNIWEVVKVNTRVWFLGTCTSLEYL